MGIYALRHDLFYSQISSMLFVDTNEFIQWRYILKNSSGIISLVLIGLAILVGLGNIFYIWPIMALAQVFLVVMASYVILMNYCRKCPHSMNESCHHVLPGRLAKRLPYKKTGKYTFFEKASVAAMVLLVFIGPLQYMVNYFMLLVYTGLWVVAIIMIRSRVCTGCYNRWCPACPNRVNQ